MKPKKRIATIMIVEFGGIAAIPEKVGLEELPVLMTV